MNLFYHLTMCCMLEFTSFYFYYTRKPEEKEFQSGEHVEFNDLNCSDLESYTILLDSPKPKRTGQMKEE